MKLVSDNMIASLCGPGAFYNSSITSCVECLPNYYSTTQGCKPYFSYGVNGSAPWGIYRAEFYNPSTNILLEAQGTGRDVLTSGTITSSSRSGNGAIQNVTSISGDTSAKLLWPNSTLSSFTICSISRYTGGTMGCILASASTSIGNFVHGHYDSKRGVAYYGQWITQQVSIGVLTNWLVMCGQNGNTIPAPNNILVDGLIKSINLIEIYVIFYS